MCSYNIFKSTFKIIANNYYCVIMISDTFSVVFIILLDDKVTEKEKKKQVHQHVAALYTASDTLRDDLATAGIVVKVLYVLNTA